ncbi:hypothetical protein [Nannocystis pusilla]|uniref:Integral membrane protein n=1 Tax=Nannocystis pusilla TaxID=889268 RepID=A0ABS7TW77_9BACT|nr:hypothetical protein [Nannocystis pusilla]MBZ5712397.1 hypothetical protein [Nannocystis pusilla]
MSLLFAIVAVLQDLLVQVFAVLATGGVVAGIVRGLTTDDLPGYLVCLAVAVAGHWILVRRIRAGHRTIHVARAGSAEVGTRSPGHFVSDVLLILALSALLAAMQGPAWGTAERAGAVSMLVACLALSGLRVLLARAGHAD